MSERFLERGGLLRVALDALPLPVFVLDGELRIRDHNAAGAAFLGESAGGALSRATGEALCCVVALAEPEGCGSGPSCSGCVLRGTAVEAIARGGQARRRGLLRRRSAQGEETFDLRATAVALPPSGEPLLLLVLEDVTELNALRDIVPICAWCKKVRNDRDFWEQVDHYLSRTHQMQFTHGMCPECRAEHFPKTPRG